MTKKESKIKLKIYTDGSCLDNGGIAPYMGLGALITSQQDIKVSNNLFLSRDLELSEGRQGGTNNLAEILAIEMALKFVLENYPFYDLKAIDVCTDSSYAWQVLYKHLKDKPVKITTNFVALIQIWSLIKLLEKRVVVRIFMKDKTHPLTVSKMDVVHLLSAQASKQARRDFSEH